MNVIHRVGPKDKFLDVAISFAQAVAVHPPLSMRAIVRARRWFLDRYTKAAAFQKAPMRLYLTEDFREAALGLQREAQAA
jgi:hypothetical protein